MGKKGDLDVPILRARLEENVWIQMSEENGQFTVV